MVSSVPSETPVTGHRMSSVVPAEATSDNRDHGLSDLDLALKLHYVRGVYVFRSEAVRNLTAYDLKEPMFPLLARYKTTSGRIRSGEGGRPLVKCNDGGVRTVEAYCDKTVEEWMSEDWSVEECLVYDQVLGPDLGFSPLVYVQFTWFKCGGISVGLSWAHILGDPFSASTFINTWAQILSGHVPLKPLHVPKPGESKCQHPDSRVPFSLKRVDPVGDHWVTTNNCKMATRSLHFTAKHLDHISSTFHGLNQSGNIMHFDILSAVIWKSLSKIKGDSGPRTVTICKRDSSASDNEFPSNHNLVFSIVQADFSVAKGDVRELAALISKKQEAENSLIEDTMTSSQDGEGDYIVYGANLTFVNLEGANIYGLEIKGHKPIYANYNIKGVGEEGTVLILPGPDNGGERGSDGRMVTMTLPENQLAELMFELKRDWNLSFEI